MSCLSLPLSVAGERGGHGQREQSETDALHIRCKTRRETRAQSSPNLTASHVWGVRLGQIAAEIRRCGRTTLCCHIHVVRDKCRRRRQPSRWEGHQVQRLSRRSLYRNRRRRPKGGEVLSFHLSMAARRAAAEQNLTIAHSDFFFHCFSLLFQFWCMVAIFVMPHSCRLLKSIFMFVMGSLLWAVPLWRNSLVFHDVDKVRRVVFLPWYSSIVAVCTHFFFFAVFCNVLIVISARGSLPASVRYFLLTARSCQKENVVCRRSKCPSDHMSRNGVVVSSLSSPRI